MLSTPTLDAYITMLQLSPMESASAEEVHVVTRPDDSSREEASFVELCE